MKYSIIKIKSKEREVTNLLNEYLQKKESFWYKKDFIFYNITTVLDEKTGYTSLRVHHSKPVFFADEIDINGLETFLRAL